jgi:alkylation response protein AidB-like acyl-CoA dehydrogenase
MDFEPSEAQELLRGNLRRLLEEVAPLAWVRERLGAAGGGTDAVWRRLAQLGLPGLLVPEAEGGAGLGMLEMGVVLEEMGRLVHPGPFLVSALGATSLLLEACAPEQRARWLPGLAAGERVATLALHEPGRGWREPEARARRRAGGWALTGEKAPVLDAAEADWLFVSARAAGGALGLFAVEAGAPGVTLRALDSVDGTRKLSALTLRGAPALRVGAGDAEAAVAATCERVAIGLAADGLGAAARAHDLAVAYAKQRHQFGRAIGAFQAVQHLLVDMLLDVELGRAGVAYALWAADAAAAPERARAAAVAKAFASEAFPRVGEGAIQVFGGLGFTWEADVHLYYKRLLSAQALFGGASEHLALLAEHVLDGGDDAPASP